MLSRLRTLACVLSFFAISVSAAQSVVVEGAVEDADGNPLAFVNVFFTDGIEGTITDREGRFKIETEKSGIRTLRISHIGYEQKDLKVDVKGELVSDVMIVLEEALLELDAVTISAGSFTMADEEGQTMTSMDVVTTAGAAADIFRAIQTLPGVTQVDEGAGLYVRGGDVTETVFLLDQATLSHPYRYESDTGGYFGMINPFLLSGTYFSSGAFSAKYGNALSGVLAMESLGMPERRSYELNLGLAAFSLGASLPVIPGKLGVRFSGNYSDTETLFKANGGSDRFDDYPVSWDGNFNMTYRYSSRGQLKLFHFANQDDIGIRYESPLFEDVFKSGTKSSLQNVQWRHLFGEGLLVKSSLSRNSFSNNLGIGNLQMDLSDSMVKWRTDVSYPLSKSVVVNSGFEASTTDNRSEGAYPADPNDLSPESETLSYDSEYDSDYAGGYLEGEISLGRKLVIISGVRWDSYSRLDGVSADPRISVSYRLTGSQILKAAWGRYRQSPQPRYLDPDFGNPELPALEAVHTTAGYELKSEMVDFRAEAYYKDYTNLPLKEGAANYSSEGHGHAYGGDLFLKGTLPVISGWISYSYLVAERKELDRLLLVPTPYDIRHNFTAALKSMVGSRNSVSATYRYTSGKPYTPAKDRWNSERLPAIQRLDLSWSYFTYFNGQNFLVLYAAVSNLLDRENIYGYIYSPDYSERTELKSTFGRNFYVGFSLSLE